MVRAAIVTLLLVLSFELNISRAEGHGRASCTEYDLSALTEALPVVRVEPVFGAQLRADGVDSCLVVVFGLKEKEGTSGEALLAHTPRSVAWSDEVPPAVRESAERAIEQWLFLAKTQPASDEAAYFIRFTF
jgi:hypothetical protein